MEKEIRIIERKILADTLTPVIVYLKLRDLFPYSVLLESSEYGSSVNGRSIICASPLAILSVNGNTITLQAPEGESKETFDGKQELLYKLDNFFSSFKISSGSEAYECNGFYGYIGYDTVRIFDEITIKPHSESHSIPEIFYAAFRFVIVFDHFRNSINLYENLLPDQSSDLDSLLETLYNRNFPIYDFQLTGKEESQTTDDEFLQMVKKGKHHCQIGDVYQVVLSRKFAQSYIGDDFNVYRSLRSINPSPYLFYFDLGEFRIFGSSPEAQLTIKNKKASILPIAGTFKRNGNTEIDIAEGERLKNDEKENAEHVMLVDLARNDLSQHGRNTRVETFKEVQFYSHVIHMVSRVTADIKGDGFHLKTVANTFPAGTLSGAPKVRAMQLVSEIENSSRGYYGGAIGYVGFNGDFNHAILIRSFFSKANKLVYQAGAGIVSKSEPVKELDEVNNKLNALRIAMNEANQVEQ